MQERIDALREQIATLRYAAYFDYGGYGPAPDSVLASMFNAWEQQHRLGPSSAEASAWGEEQVETARQAVANEFHALPEQVAFGTSVSALLNTVLWGFEWNRGDHLVVSSAEHAATLAAVNNLQSRRGVEVTRWDGARFPASDLLDSLGETLRANTRLLLISHVVWSTGETLPVSLIANFCHQRTSGPPVAVVVNGAQSFGAIPFAAGELHADYFVGTMHKWCCGPDAMAVLFARDPDSLLPTFAGWRSVDEHLRPHTGLRKLETGQPCYAAHAGVREVLLLHEQAGPPPRRHAMLQTRRERLRLGLEDIAARRSRMTLLTPACADSGILSFTLHSGAHRDLVARLESAGVLVRAVSNPGCIRVCTHYFTTDSEIDLLLQGIEDFAR